MIGQHGPGAVQLLGQQYAYHGMRQRQVRQAQPFMRCAAQIRVQPIRPAYKENHITTMVAPVFEPRGKLERGVALPSLIQRHHICVARNGSFDARTFGSHELLGRLAAAAWLRLDGFELQPHVCRKALGVLVKPLLRPVGHFLPHGNNGELAHAFNVWRAAMSA